MLKKNRLPAFAAFLFCIGLGSLNAQTFVSPFSHSNLGELQNQSLISRRGIGGTSIAFSDSNSFNPLNPASAALLRSFDVEAALELKYDQIDNNGTLYPNKNAAVPYIALGFPIRRDTSLRIGFFTSLSPVSRLGYKIRGTFPDDSGRAEVLRGDGGTNRFQVGLSANIFRFLHLGLGASYIFGTENFYDSLTFTDNSNRFSLNQNTTRNIHGLAFDAGLITGFKTSALTRLNIGLLANVPSNIGFKDSKVAYTYSSLIGQIVKRDTVSDVTGHLFLPLGLGGGFEFQILEKTRHLARWTIAADAYYRQWSKYSVSGQGQNLKDYSSLSAGLQWTPYFFRQLEQGGAGKFLYYLNYIRYRVGFQYAMLPYVTASGFQFSETKLTFGLGFPLPDRPINTIRSETVVAPRIVDALSFLNFAVEAGQITAPGDNALSQKYIALSIGIHLFEPGWFYRRRIE